MKDTIVMVGKIILGIAIVAVIVAVLYPSISTYITAASNSITYTPIP